MQGNCSVCSDPETSENRVIICKTCNVKVHLLCYGVEEFQENWECSPCKVKKLEPVCKLCVQEGDAMKETVCWWLGARNLCVVY